MVADYAYGPWGQLAETTGEVDNPFLYAGEYTDPTGLQYLRARYYDPGLGRFLTEDTYTGELNDPASMHLYVYVRNNPLMYTDPSGHIPAEYNPFRKEYWQDYDAKAETVFGAIRDWGPVGEALEIPARGLVGIGRFMAVDDIMTLADECTTDGEKLLAGISLVPFGKIAKVKKVADATFDAGSAGKKVVQEAVDSSQGRIYSHKLDLQMFADETGELTRKQAFREAKEAAGIPKSAQFERHSFVYDGTSENRTVYQFTVDGKKRYIVLHQEDKLGRGPHFHGADDAKGSPFEKGRYNQYDGHFPENLDGFRK